MIQDIAPHQYQVAYRPAKPRDSDLLLIYRGDSVLLRRDGGQISYPSAAEIREVFPSIGEKAKFLFRIDSCDYYELRSPVLEPFGPWRYEPVLPLRDARPTWRVFAAITGFQIHNWYTDNAFCGRCASRMHPSAKERAMECPSCGRTVYPTIAPSVIVAITDGGRLLVTRYAASHSRHRNYALVAGYTEVGETLEQTVRREVMEEVGLKVKNIRYYKSQPWSFSGSLLMGFFCEVDGDPTVTLDESELAEAVWLTREELPKSGLSISLTSEMIELFRTGKAY